MKLSLAGSARSVRSLSACGGGPGRGGFRHGRSRCGESPHPALRADLPRKRRAIAFEREPGGVVSLRPILRDARLWRAPQDEVLFRGEILYPHGEERRLRRVSNHEAEYATGPDAIALPF